MPTEKKDRTQPAKKRKASDEDPDAMTTRGSAATGTAAGGGGSSKSEIFDGDSAAKFEDVASSSSGKAGRVVNGAALTNSGYADAELDDDDDDLDGGADVDEDADADGGAGSVGPRRAQGRPEAVTSAPSPRWTVKVSRDVFDVEAFLSLYSGHAKIIRALFLADHCEELAVEAMRHAYNELKRSSNTALYENVAQRLARMTHDVAAPDAAWLEHTAKRAEATLDRFEQELAVHKSNLVKESVRLTLNSYGDFLYECGDLNGALKRYMQCKDYCTSPKHTVQMCMSIIRLSLELDNYVHVPNYLAKADSSCPPDDLVTQAKLNVCHGLCNLELKRYKLAARKFLSCHFDQLAAYTEVIAAQDVAVYGALLALASFDRKELKTLLIENLSFKSFLELVPSVRDLVADFYGSRPAQCFKLLESFKAQWKLDPHLHDHIDTLFADIRTKSLVQYFSPFISINIPQMADAFNTSVDALTAELAQLIMANLIEARIDSHNKRLYARKTDQRSATFAKALSMGEENSRRTQATLLRVNLMRRDFVVKAPKEQRGRGMPDDDDEMGWRQSPFSS